MSNSISILVDYAHEPQSMRRLLETLQDWRERGLFDQVIHLVSCDGVGRDDWKKPILGDLSYNFADFSIVTTDNYEAGDNPEDILNLLTQNFPSSSLGEKYFTHISRLEAMRQSLQLAGSLEGKVLIVSTGVGCEQFLTQPEGNLAWDEREVWKQEWENFSAAEK